MSHSPNYSARLKTVAVACIVVASSGCGLMGPRTDAEVAVTEKPEAVGACEALGTVRPTYLPSAGTRTILDLRRGAMHLGGNTLLVRTVRSEEGVAYLCKPALSRDDPRVTSIYARQDRSPS